MKNDFSADEWTIYNCHIHTFTKKNTPRGFIRYVLSDARTGKINWWRVPIYVIFLAVYISLFLFVPTAILWVAANPSFFSLTALALLIPIHVALILSAIILVVAFVLLGVVLVLQTFVKSLMEKRSDKLSQGVHDQLMQLKNVAQQGQRRLVQSNVFINLLVKINPASNDIFERTARFLKTSEQPTQEDVFEQVYKQYPRKPTGRTEFVVLPMDMTFMNFGPLPESIEQQHKTLLDLAKKHEGLIIPFYAADPRQPNIVQRVKDNVTKDKFRGVKLYPNLGYKPDDENLLEIYKYCISRNIPVLTHCTPSGVWQYGMSEDKRREYSQPSNYRNILDQKEYRNLKICLAHFGGAEEWERHLKRRDDADDQKKGEPWVKTIYDMIVSGKYPNLYTDISYTVFTPKFRDLYIDLLDYLKVLLSNPRLRRRVLFGSDYYMVERENMSEKEVSILLRSRLGEDLYKQIAHTNPREFLNIETRETVTVRAKKPVRRNVLA